MKNIIATNEIFYFLKKTKKIAKKKIKKTTKID